MTPKELKELKELYATGEWLCVSAYLKNSIAIEWELNEDPSWWNIEDTVNGCAYKLIHKKHSEVLDHVLNGGSVAIMKQWWEVEKDFFTNYSPDNEYKILTDNKPSLNGSYNEAMERANTHQLMIEELNKPTERITRGMLDEARDYGDMKLIQDYAYQLLAYLEANQREK